MVSNWSCCGALKLSGNPNPNSALTRCHGRDCDFSSGNLTRLITPRICPSAHGTRLLICKRGGRFAFKARLVLRAMQCYVYCDLCQPYTQPLKLLLPRYFFHAYRDNLLEVCYCSLVGNLLQELVIELL